MLCLKARLWLYVPISFAFQACMLQNCDVFWEPRGDPALETMTVWVEKDHLTMPLMQCYFSCCHAQMKTCGGRENAVVCVFECCIFFFL